MRIESLVDNAYRIKLNRRAVLKTALGLGTALLVGCDEELYSGEFSPSQEKEFYASVISHINKARKKKGYNSAILDPTLENVSKSAAQQWATDNWSNPLAEAALIVPIVLNQYLLPANHIFGIDAAKAGLKTRPETLAQQLLQGATIGNQREVGKIGVGIKQTQDSLLCIVTYTTRFQGALPNKL